MSKANAMTRFEGFADKSGAFFKRLAKNNERAWFLEHKAVFEEGWNAPMKPDAKLATWLAGACKTAAPLVEWLTFATA
jgi:hypothetical protein